MERLTYTDEELAKFEDMDCPVKANYLVESFCDYVCEEFQHNCPFMKMAQKLKAYEDKQEQGLLIELPCKAGDEIYVIPSDVNYRLNKSFGQKGLNVVRRQVVDHIEFNSYGYLVSTNEGMTVHRQEVFGETWFLTRSEAEEALAKMGE